MKKVLMGSSSVLGGFGLVGLIIAWAFDMQPYWALVIILIALLGLLVGFFAGDSPPKSPHSSNG